MNVNQLLHDHQIALINAGNGQIEYSGQGFRIVRHYAKRIARLRSELGVPQYWLTHAIS